MHVADRWQAFSIETLDPLNFKTDSLWAIYWSMFQCEQSIANYFAQSNALEDVHTGIVIAQIDRWLSDWAKKRIAEFGYPDSTSYMGAFAIAGKAEETRTGADLGLIIDINIGALVC